MKTTATALFGRQILAAILGIALLATAAFGNTISVNVAANATGNSAIDSETFGILLEESVAGNWNDIIAPFGAANPKTNLLRADGTSSGVEVVARNGGGQQFWGSDYINTPWNYGLAHFTGTTGPVSLTFNNLAAEFPLGYYAIVYVNGPAANQGAAITDGTTTYYFQTSDPATATPIRITDTVNDDLYQAGNYALFGSASSPLTADSVTFSIPTGSIVSNNAGIGGVQLIAIPEPSTVALLLGGGVLLLAFLKRQRS